MNVVNKVYIFVLFMASAIAIIVALMAWKRRNSKGAKPLVVLMSAIFVWTLFQAFTIIGNEFTIKLILANIRYFGIEIAPIAFYALAYGYKPGTKVLGLTKWLLFMIFPVFSLIAIWTNPLHHMFYTQVGIEDHNLFMGSGILFWINMIYLYIFVLIGFYIFIKASFNSISIYRGQAIIMAVAAFFPILANIVFNFNLLPIGNMDITSLSFLISGVLFFYALFMLKLFDIVPIAKDTLVEEMMDIVIVIDINRRVLNLNKKAREIILEGNDKAYVGKEFSSIVNGWKDLDEFVGRSENKSLKINHTVNVTTRYYDINTSNIYNGKREKIGEFIILRDITELEEALIRTQKAREQAEDANRAKGDFLENMSHEIRTPINAVIGTAEILNTMNLSNEQKKYMEIISNSAEALLLIIDGILDVSKIEAGKIEIEKREFDIKKITKDIIDTFSLLAQNKRLKLISRIDENISSRILGDEVRVKQILINLIANAIKFTIEGEVEVSITQTKIEQNRSIIEIKVSDTGIGISKKKIEVIFESFKKADDSSTRRYGGIGLGLSIVRSLVELMGGKIYVESELEKGSTFYCNIPFDVEDEKVENSSKVEQNKKEYPKLSNCKVLVAEDNNINRKIMEKYLIRLSCVYDFAENGIEAVDKYKSGDFNIILMDVQMPEMDGQQATRIIREMELEKGGHIPIIALTASFTEEDIRKCIESGMDKHLLKPIKMDTLYHTIKLYEQDHTS
jgi:signal transduction histidine kinase